MQGKDISKNTRNEIIKVKRENPTISIRKLASQFSVSKSVAHNIINGTPSKKKKVVAQKKRIRIHKPNISLSQLHLIKGKKVLCGSKVFYKTTTDKKKVTCNNCKNVLDAKSRPKKKRVYCPDRYEVKCAFKKCSETSKQYNKERWVCDHHAKVEKLQSICRLPIIKEVVQ